MILLQSGSFDVARYITHPISLVAYVCALILYYFISKNVNDRKKLEANPEAYKATAERLELNLDLISEGQRASVTMRVLKNRIVSQLITAVSLIIGGLIVSYLFINYTQEQRKLNDGERKQREIERKASLDEVRQKNAQIQYEKAKADSTKLVREQYVNRMILLMDRGKELLKKVHSGDEMAWGVTRHSYLNDVDKLIMDIKVKTNDRTYFLKSYDYGRRNTPDLSMYSGYARRFFDSAQAVKDLNFYVELLEEQKVGL